MKEVLAKELSTEATEEAKAEFTKATLKAKGLA